MTTILPNILLLLNCLIKLNIKLYSFIQKKKEKTLLFILTTIKMRLIIRRDRFNILIIDSWLKGK